MWTKTQHLRWVREPGHQYSFRMNTTPAHVCMQHFVQRSGLWTEQYTEADVNRSIWTHQTEVLCKRLQLDSRADFDAEDSDEMVELDEKERGAVDVVLREHFRRLGEVVKLEKRNTLIDGPIAGRLVGELWRSLHPCHWTEEHEKSKRKWELAFDIAVFIWKANLKKSNDWQVCTHPITAKSTYFHFTVTSLPIHLL